jgi:hypothetical protein
MSAIGVIGAIGAVSAIWAPSAPARAAPAASPTEQQCLDRFRADTARIEREFAARRRTSGPPTPAGDQAWARDLHAALAKAADAAEACSRDARRARR